MVVHTEFVRTENEDGFVDFESENLRLDEGERSAVDLDQAFALLAESYGCRGLLLAALYQS